MDPQTTQKDEDLADGKEPDVQKIHEEEERLKAFQASGHISDKQTGRMFGAVSMYGVAVDFGLAILVPLLVFIYLGRWLEGRLDQEWPVPVGILVALAVSGVSIYRQVMNLKKKIKL